MSQETTLQFPVLIPAKQIALILDVSLRTVWRLRAASKLPRSVEIGKSVRWKAEEIAEWIDAGCPCLDDWEAMTSPVTQ
ncbi:uncharacterized protein METZ01_LOCUS488160 [marine metagenome]|uniref:Helix-turn-helix domain-containing protein n=1 Tax=marine metagenome TaxID=408172 RepID=A0A383CSI1_9ZZZZ